MSRAASANAQHGSVDVAPPAMPGQIMLTAAALVAVGVVMIYSASADVATADADVTPAPTALPGHAHALAVQVLQTPGLRQLLFVPIALIAMWLASHVPYTFWRIRGRWWLSPSLWLLLFALGLLAAVLVVPESIAPAINGAKRWFQISAGGFSISFQPSELAKIALVLALAGVLSDARFDAKRIRGLLVLVAMCGAVFLLVAIEDFGTAALIGMVVFFLLLAGGARWWHLCAWIPPAVAAGVWFILDKQYRIDRVMAWWHGGGDPAREGYHVHQSLLAIASGGWWGRGLGEGIQKLGYLPEDTTDFIFPIICEELGLLGGMIVIGLFIVLLWQLRPARSCPDRLGQLIKLGVALLIGLQAAMNVAVVTGTVPAKGIALPFVSAGGSGLVLLSVALGLAANVNRTVRRELAVGE